MVWSSPPWRPCWVTAAGVGDQIWPTHYVWALPGGFFLCCRSSSQSTELNFSTMKWSIINKQYCLENLGLKPKKSEPREASVTVPNEDRKKGVAVREIQQVYDVIQNQVVTRIVMHLAIQRGIFLTWLLLKISVLSKSTCCNGNYHSWHWGTENTFHVTPGRPFGPNFALLVASGILPWMIEKTNHFMRGFP